MILTATDIEHHGLEFAGVFRGRKSEKRLREDFKKHYGSSPVVLAEQWADLCEIEDTNLALSKQEKSMKGLKRFFMAHFWLWAKPKNAAIFSSHFKICEDYCCGAPFWLWIERLAELGNRVIRFDPALLSAEAAVMGFSADGVDFGMWEVQHPQFPHDKKTMSHKMKRCAAKYVLILSAAYAKCLKILGPFKGGVNDNIIFKESGILEQFKDAGKVCNVDRGFRMEDKELETVLCFPDYMDESDLHEFKDRVRLRQETFNSRLKYFRTLSEIFEYGYAKHKLVMYAVAGIVQYQMDLGCPIFEV